MSFVIFKIRGITCKNCKIRIENHLMTFEGIKKVDVNWKKALVTVEYDENIIGLDKIKQEIESLDYKRKRGF
ncbi:MAG: heavy-metal-associated domain-containing protein [Treponema sp.]